MDKARKELSFAKEFDVILVNDNLKEACNSAEEKVREFLAKP